MYGLTKELMGLLINGRHQENVLLLTRLKRLLCKELLCFTIVFVAAPGMDYNKVVCLKGQHKYCPYKWLTRPTNTGRISISVLNIQVLESPFRTSGVTTPTEQSRIDSRGVYETSILKIFNFCGNFSWFCSFTILQNSEICCWNLMNFEHFRNF